MTGVLDSMFDADGSFVVGENITVADDLMNDGISAGLDDIAVGADLDSFDLGAADDSSDGLGESSLDMGDWAW